MLLRAGSGGTDDRVIDAREIVKDNDDDCFLLLAQHGGAAKQTATPQQTRAHSAASKQKESTNIISPHSTFGESGRLLAQIITLLL